MYQSIDEYYQDVMAHGTGPAKILMTEEALMSGNLATKLASPMRFNDQESPEQRAQKMQREIMALLHAHRGMVIANFLMERAEGHPMGSQGPVVTAQPLMEGRPEENG